MAEKVFSFGFGNGVQQLVLPGDKPINEIDGRPFAPLDDVAGAVREALLRPIGSPPLAEVVKPGDRVAVVVGDVTRAWVKFGHFLPVLLDELNAAGIPDKDIFMVIGLGTHRAHTPEEDVLVCGPSVCHRVAIYQHNCRDQAALAYLGDTSRGVPVHVNKQVAEADKVIITGGIVYHPMSGFGGGRKAVMPGISGYASIQGNHLLCLNETVGAGLNPDSDLGLLAGNAMHEDMAEATALLNPAFLLNAVFTPEGAFAGFFAGHWYKAWEAGTELVKGIYGIPLAAPSELVIASAGGFPKDINLYQSAKTIVNAAAAVKDGGVVICVLECRDIAEPPEFSDWFKYQDMLEFEHALRRRFTIPGYIAFRCTDIARRNTLIIVTKPENAAFVRQAGMLFAADVTEAYAMAKQRLGQDDFSVTIMRNGANTVPILTLE